MDTLEIEHLISELTDLDLAVLLSLVAQEHCLIETTEDCIDDVSKELALVLSAAFQLIPLPWLTTSYVDLPEHVWSIICSS